MYILREKRHRQTDRQIDRIRSLEGSKLILEEQHFCSNGHDIKRDFKFKIIEKIRKKKIY